jgi:predicted lipoprotein with Yx(FWY)xxD motif
MRRLTAVLVLPIAIAMFAGCGSSGGGTTTTSESMAEAPAEAGPAVEVSSANVSGLGEVLVNDEGMTLYVFAPDKAKAVTCEGSCASVWPPLKLEGGQKAGAAGKVRAPLLGSDPDPEGGEVVTYAGWPLYSYVADTEPGQANGQAINLNGGYWYVITPAGKVIK